MASNRKVGTMPAPTPPVASEAPVWVEMLTGLSGPDFAVSPGDVHPVTADEAERLVRAGFATYSGSEWA